MTQQQALSFPASYVGKEAWRSQLEAIRSAVKHLGPKEVAFDLDIGGTQLADAINERDRKVWHAAWSQVLKAMLVAKRDPTATELLGAICEADVITTPFVLSLDTPMTPEEENAALRRELARFGDAGKQAAARVGKGKRR